MLPAEDRDGYAVDASEVGDNGEKNGVSWPITTDVFFQSRLSRAVRNRPKPAVTPSLVTGKPPKKSNLRSPDVLAPPHCGPKTSRLSSDCRTVAAVLPPD